MIPNTIQNTIPNASPDTNPLAKRRDSGTRTGDDAGLGQALAAVTLPNGKISTGSIR